MPLAEKIIQLRKRQGWSQIDLADRLDVSRQSVSKWEMAQAMPEPDKIVRLSELFSVTTDYLLKDEPAAPAPEPEAEEGAGPETGPGPAPETAAPEPPAKRPPRKKWPWVLAACLVLVFGLVTLAVLSLSAVPGGSDVAVFTQTAVQGEAEGAPPSLSGFTQETAVAEEQAPGSGSCYTYEKAAVTLHNIEPEAMKAIAREYEPFGITYDAERDAWYYKGEPIRSFTDVLSSNGESLTGGNFRGVIRNFAGEGTVDVRAVRDYDQADEDGTGRLTGVEVVSE